MTKNSNTRRPYGTIGIAWALAAKWRGQILIRITSSSRQLRCRSRTGKMRREEGGTR